MVLNKMQLSIILFFSKLPGMALYTFTSVPYTEFAITFLIITLKQILKHTVFIRNITKKTQIFLHFVNIRQDNIQSVISFENVTNNIKSHVMSFSIQAYLDRYF